MTRDERKSSWAQIDVNLASGNRDLIGDVRAHMIALAVSRITRAQLKELKVFADERQIDLSGDVEKHADGPQPELACSRFERGASIRALLFNLREVDRSFHKLLRAELLLPMFHTVEDYVTRWVADRQEADRKLFLEGRCVFCGEKTIEGSHCGYYQRTLEDIENITSRAKQAWTR